MNMLTSDNLEDLKKDAETAENPTLKRLMKAWESKQARTARKAGGLGMVAVSLAACGSDSDGDGGDPVEEILGNIFTLTTDADTPENLESTGESDIPGDIFNAPLGVGIDGLVGVQTLQEADVIVGTDEIDVLNAALNGTGAGGTYAAPTIQDVEVLNLTARGGFDDFFFDVPFDGPVQLSSITSVIQSGLDLFNATGYEQIWNINSDFDLAVVNIGENAAIGMRDVTGGTTYALQFTSSADTEVVNVIADAVGTSQATGQAYLNINAVNGIETLNLDVSNTVRLDLQDDAASIEVFNIAGSGLTQLSGEDEFPNLVQLDAGDYTDDLTLDVSGSSVLTNVLTGPGDDAIRVNKLAVDGGLSVDLGADSGGVGDILEIDTNPTFYAADINALDFTGGVTGVENLAFVNLVDLDGYGEAVLDLDGISDDLGTIWFYEGIDGSGHPNGELALANSPVPDLTINATNIDELDLDTGNVVNLEVNATAQDGELDLDAVSGASLETLTLNQTTGIDGELYLDIDSDDDNDVSALQTISATAAGSADVELDADDDDADMNALTSISVVAGDDADLEMDGVPAERQEQKITVTGSNLGSATGSVTLDIPGQGLLTLDTSDLPNVNDAFDGTGYSAELTNSNSTTAVLTVTRDDFGPVAPITIDSFDGSGITNANIETEVSDPGVAPDSFMGLEDAVVSGDESADVDIEDVYGSFTLDVTANGVLLDDDAEVDLDDTNVTEVTVTVNTAVEYNAGVTDHVDDGTGHADIDIEGSSSSDQYGNPFLTSLTVTSATADIELDDDLSSMTTIDLTGVVDQFDVDASGAEYAEGSNVLYLIGTTSSDITNQNGDSSLTFGGGSVDSVREVATFTEEDFGTVVINNFEASSADPDETDRIDLSDLGFSNEGQLDFEQGSYDDTTGVFTSGNGSGNDDYRIIDGNLTDSADMGGEIIVTEVGDGNVEDLQSNMVYV